VKQQEYQIVVKKKVIKSLQKLPLSVQQRFQALALDLREHGPCQYNWPNYSPLHKNHYHCHLNRSWVAYWQNRKDDIIVEVYYVGSREKAPY
jgi:mRNA-degrading endonuclease RelE of RelBE toxin-antitoxin system